ncbi:putative bifunctional diguanylate cyclase/phosphodiesterase [Kineosporia succinea]|uniref:Diguanylate cyclase (GGDEF)-like protein n=1 Tax=Kineosporia succinea TaxID=84632 RepID=A0ABT9PB41_9ACTN|nr:EAL domain-containing protein [Kineosporia succinea]MDP9829250.1 diguanylate cyclase (GGDEF)-like protein [Kineosporia succinea]
MSGSDLPASRTWGPGRLRARGSWSGQRGRPVWQSLAVLTVLPLLAATVMGGVLFDAADRAADRALRAQRLVSAVELLDGARRAVDAEVLPTMLMRVVEDEDLAVAAGFSPARAGALRATQAAVVTQAREATDRAIDAARAGATDPDLKQVVTRALTAVTAARAAADGTGEPLVAVVGGFGRGASGLAAGQRWAGTEAVSAGLGSRSVASLQDLTQLLALSEAASRQLGELFASRVLPAADRLHAQSGWIASWGTYTKLAEQADDFVTEPVRQDWAVYTDDAAVAAFSDLMTRQALSPGTAVLPTGALPALGERSRARDEALAVVLQDAVAEVSDASGDDHAAAERHRRTTLAICLALILLSLANAGLIARWLTASMRSLAVGARQVSLGNLVDVAPRGPRELRTAAHALSAAVAGLRRVQEQARAVVDGNAEEALRQKPLPGPLGDVVHASVEQIVESFRAREALQDELAHQATHDALTGLANRAQILATLSQLLAGEPPARTGVLFIDLDGFKLVNDTHGHAVGDQVLCEVAARLTGALRPADGVGRFGGDEFVVTVEGAHDAAALMELGRRLIGAISFSGPLDVGGTTVRQVRIGASVGVAVSSPGSTADSLLAEADMAAYRAKRLGRGRVEIFDDDLRAEITERAALEVALRAGLEAGELHLHYQPVVDLRTGTVTGYEALARWDRPGVGPVRPDVFIAAAEASSFVCDLGRWVLHEATAQAAGWRGASIAVNVSGRHLTDHRVLDDVRDALSASGLAPALLVVEITETVLTDDPRAREHLRILRAEGVRVAIDDFGTGFTSISALADTPADILKIDRSFIGSDDPGHHQLATLIARAAHTFDLRVVAEGIETGEQLARVRADGCEEAQGYLFSRPLAPEAVERLPAQLISPDVHVPVPRAPEGARRESHA